MSLILKGIDLPKDGEWLSVIIKPTKEVIVDTIRYGDYALLKTEYNSAIQIPKGHGRLIDADKIDYDEFWHREGQGFTIGVCQKAQQIIEEQPTILEAEE